MIWAVNVVGDATEIARAFTKVIDDSNGMPDGEADDIEEVRDFAKSIATAHGKVWVQAHGSCSTIDPNPPKFSQISITISEAPKV